MGGNLDAMNLDRSLSLKAAVELGGAGGAPAPLPLYNPWSPPKSPL